MRHKQKNTTGCCTLYENKIPFQYETGIGYPYQRRATGLSRVLGQHEVLKVQLQKYA